MADYDLAFRPDGVPVMRHQQDRIDGEWVSPCGSQPFPDWEPPEGGFIPACPKCFDAIWLQRETAYRAIGAYFGRMDRAMDELRTRLNLSEEKVDG